MKPADCVLPHVRRMLAVPIFPAWGPVPTIEPSAHVAFRRHVKPVTVNFRESCASPVHPSCLSCRPPKKLSLLRTWTPCTCRGCVRASIRTCEIRKGVTALAEYGYKNGRGHVVTSSFRRQASVSKLSQSTSRRALLARLGLAVWVLETPECRKGASMGCFCVRLRGFAVEVAVKGLPLPQLVVI